MSKNKKVIKKHYKHLDIHMRDRIEALLSKGSMQIDIASILNIHKSTVSREIQRHKLNSGVYKAEVAEHKASVARSNSKYQGMKIEKNQELRTRITTALTEKRSPDEIAGRMKREKLKVRIGKDALYRWLYSSYGQSYCKYLCSQRYRVKKHRQKTKRSIIPNRINVLERPKTRGLIHAEGDLFVSPTKTGSQVSGAVIVIHKTKLLRLERIDNKKPSTMKNVVNHIKKETHFDDLTLDNGIENRYHEQFSVPTYFCDPHSPWQKPLVEGSIGLVRRWALPKGTNLSTVSKYRFKKIENFLNNKWRKSLGYQSANEYSVKCGIIKRY